MAIWIKGGEVVDPVKGMLKKLDIVIDRGRITKIVPEGEFREQGPQLDVIDAFGKIVVPGLVDMHVHLREPGHEHKETIASGGTAGVAGGFTGLACMPNTDPVNDVVSVTRFIQRKAHEADLVKVYPVAAVTRGQGGEILTEFDGLRKAGAIGVSDDGLSIADTEVMRRALECAREQGLVVIDHCEDRNLSAGGVMHKGAVSTRLGMKGIPSSSEENMVKRDLSLAKLTRCPVHIAHVSTAGSVDLIRKAKEEGVLVTAETAPHYFSLDHSSVLGYNTNAKMNPPLRGPEDVLAIKKGLAENIIDVIATDHAPHSPAEKDLEFVKAPFGIIGLETALPLTLALVREGRLSLPDAIKKLSYGPASILGVPGGLIAEGGPADVAIIDTEYEYTLKPEDIQSKSRNSPFIGKRLKGRNELTLIGGRVVWESERVHSGR